MMSVSTCFHGLIFIVLFIIYFQSRSSDLVFEDVDEDFDQELGQLSLGTLSRFCECCTEPLALQFQRVFFFIRKDRYLLGGVSWYIIFNFELTIIVTVLNMIRH